LSRQQEKRNSTQGVPLSLTTDRNSRNFIGQQQHEFFVVLKENCQPRTLYLAKLRFKEREIRTLQGKPKDICPPDLF
jgi:hypothetical protein